MDGKQGDYMTGTFTFEDGVLTLHTTVEKRMSKQQCDEKLLKLEMAEFQIVQLRRLTPDQHRTIFMLYGTIKDITGQDTGDLHELLFTQFQLQYGYTDLSTSFKKENALSVQQASEYIDWLLCWGIENGMPLYIIEGYGDNKRVRKPFEICSDIRKYIITCILNETCCVTGKTKPETHISLHHYDRIGSAHRKNDDGGYRVISITGELHSKWHDLDGDELEKELDTKFHLKGINLSEYELLIFCAKGIYSGMHFDKFRQTHKQQIAEVKEELERMGKL